MDVRRTWWRGKWRLDPANSTFSNGGGGGWVIGPGVFGVAAFEFFADFRVGVGPEAGEVVGDLLGSEVGCEQVQQNGDSVERDAWSLGEAEDFLDANGEDRWAIGGVFEFDATAAGYREFFGGFAFDGLELLVVEAGLECLEPGGVAKFGEGRSVCAE